MRTSSDPAMLTESLFMPIEEDSQSFSKVERRQTSAAKPGMRIAFASMAVDN